MKNHKLKYIFPIVILISFFMPFMAGAMQDFTTINSINSTAEHNIEFYASPAHLPIGTATTTLWWSANWADSCFASGNWHGQVELTGNQIVNPRLKTTELTLTCSNKNTSLQKTITITAYEPKDILPPIVRFSSPNGIVALNENINTLTVHTNENAICRYSPRHNINYESKEFGFEVELGATHIAPLHAPLNLGQSYAYYVSCKDTAGNIMTHDYQILFGIAQHSKKATAIKEIARQIKELENIVAHLRSLLPF